MGGICSTHGVMRNLYNVLVLIEQSLGKTPLGRPWRRWEDNIDLKKKGECVDWIRLTQNRIQRRALVNAIIVLQLTYILQPFHFILTQHKPLLTAV
jgi:hypothetical protein